MDPANANVIASCSGDGLPLEVLNGLSKAKDASRAPSKVAVVQLPCGTTNAMNWNSNGTDSTSVAALCIAKGIRITFGLGLYYPRRQAEAIVPLPICGYSCRSRSRNRKPPLDG